MRISPSLGMDEPMAKHFAHLYIRDPLTLFSEKIDLNDEEDSDHFEVNKHVLICPIYCN